MEDNKWLKKYFNEIRGIFNINNFGNLIIAACKMLRGVFDENKKIFFLGNGASNIIASHAALDYTNNLNIRAYSFDSVGMLTAFANDFGYEQAMIRFLDFYMDNNDMLVLISSSGQSMNLYNAGIAAHKKYNAKIITFTGFRKNNLISKLGNINFWINSNKYNIVEGLHNLLLTTMLDFMVKNVEVGVHGHEFK
mgnify:CR=1 FL=1